VLDPRLRQEEIVQALFVRNDRLTDALMLQASATLRVLPGARAFNDAQRGNGLEHSHAELGHAREPAIHHLPHSTAN
jgi:hypothetical protein